jgi:hypothetical protein
MRCYVLNSSASPYYRIFKPTYVVTAKRANKKMMFGHSCMGGKWTRYDNQKLSEIYYRVPDSAILLAVGSLP